MLSRKIVKYRFNIDLDLSMYPSFASVMFKRISRNTWVKYWGVGRGTVIYVRNGELICEGNICDDEELIKLWCGAWYDPVNMLKRIGLRNEVRDLIKELMMCLKGLRLVINPIERLPILLATFLSRRTDYHLNVIKWVEKILTKCLSRDLNLNRECLLEVGSSYQLKQLNEVLDSLESIAGLNTLDHPWRIRGKLLKVKYVGPKVADSYLLFTTTSGLFTPSDIHYLRFLKYTGLINYLSSKGLLIPNKHLCLRYGPECNRCSLSIRCLTGQSIHLFGELSGYVQTMAYVIDKLLSNRASYLSTYLVRIKWCIEKVLMNYLSSKVGNSDT